MAIKTFEVEKNKNWLKDKIKLTTPEKYTDEIADLNALYYLYCNDDKKVSKKQTPMIGHIKVNFLKRCVKDPELKKTMREFIKNDMIELSSNNVDVNQIYFRKVFFNDKWFVYSSFYEDSKLIVDIEKLRVNVPDVVLTEKDNIQIREKNTKVLPSRIDIATFKFLNGEYWKNYSSGE